MSDARFVAKICGTIALAIILLVLALGKLARWWEAKPMEEFPPQDDAAENWGCLFCMLAFLVLFVAMGLMNR